MGRLDRRKRTYWGRPRYSCTENQLMFARVWDTVVSALPPRSHTYFYDLKMALALLLSFLGNPKIMSLPPAVDCFLYSVLLGAVTLALIAIGALH